MDDERIEKITLDMNAATLFVKEFYPAEWGGARGISDTEASALVRGILIAALGEAFRLSGEKS